MDEMTFEEFGRWVANDKVKSVWEVNNAFI